MAASVELTVPKLKSLPNFRVLSAKYQTCCKSYKGIIYRSSRPDLINETDARSLKNLGINSIIDLRSRKEYAASSGDKLLDFEFQLCKVNLIHGRNYKPQESVEITKLEKEPNSSCQNKDAWCKWTCECTESEKAKPIFIEHDRPSGDNTELTQHQLTVKAPVLKAHYLINMFSWTYLWTVLARASLFIQLMSLLYLLVDLIFGTGYKYVLRFCAHYFLNDAGLIGQYRDTVDICQNGICAALKLLTNPNNLPALLNCAIGKDRTGIVSALVLHCLGQSKAFIAQDYAKSAAGLEPVMDRIHREVIDRWNLSEDFISAKEETMLQLLQYIEDKYGSITNYLECIGFGSSEQEKLRQLAGVAV